MSTELPKAYSPKSVEDKIYKLWEESGFFTPENLPGNRKEVFSLALPPPNATGTLHLGHALEYSIQDAVVRYQRMRGKKTLWIPGTQTTPPPHKKKKKKKKKIKKKEKKNTQHAGGGGFLKKIVFFFFFFFLRGDGGMICA